MPGDQSWSEQPALLTSTEAASIFLVQPKTIVDRLSRSELPGYRFARTWHISSSELRDHVTHTRLGARAADKTSPHFLAGYPDTLDTDGLVALFRHDRRTLYVWLQNGILPGIRSGRAWLVFRHDLRVAFDEARNDAPRYHR